MPRGYGCGASITDYSACNYRGSALTGDMTVTSAIAKGKVELPKKPA